LGIGAPAGGLYATVQDLRGEGVSTTEATDQRLLALIEEASREIDHLTGWFFYPRQLSLKLSGRGTPSLEPPYPPIMLSDLDVDGRDLSIAADDLMVVGAPIAPGFDAPRLTILGGGVFPEGSDNITADGWWGYTEEDGSPLGRTPLEIRRACMLLVLRTLPMLADADAVADARSQWRIIQEKTRDQSYKLDRLRDAAPLTGDPEIDRILLRYRRPSGLGAI